MNLKHVLAVLLLAGCQSTAASRNDVVLLGDDSRLSLSSSGSLDAPPANASASEVANASLRAKHAVIVVDAESGPLPVTREHIIIARQAGVASMSMLVVNTAALDRLPDKASIIDLEIAEVRQIFDAYDMKGGMVPVFFEEAGLASIVDDVSTLPARAIEADVSTPRQKFSGVLYLLSAPESAGVSTIRSGDAVTAWINGQTVSATAQAKESIEPGEVADIELKMEVPLAVSAGQRFLFESQGKIVGAGVVTK